MEDITWIDDIINNHQKSKYKLYLIKYNYFSVE